MLADPHDFDPHQYEAVEPLGEWDPGDGYHEQPGISSSQLKVAATNMRLFERKYVTMDADRDFAQENSNALLIGNIVHTMILEPEKLAYRYVPEPDFSEREFLTSSGKVAKNPKATTEYAEAVKEYEEQHPGCKLVKREDWDLCLKMVASYQRSEDAQRIVRAVKRTEVPFRFKDHKRQMLWRVMFDGLGDGIIVDLKTCYDAKPVEFLLNVHRFKYLGSMALYCLGYRVATGKWPLEFYLIALGKKEPYDVVPYKTLEHFDLGWNWINKWMDRVAEGKRTGQWDSEWHKGVQELPPLKGWMLAEYA